MLREGRSIEAVFDRATRSLRNPADRQFALAIAGEVLRRLPDYDRLIDSATKKPLPDDAKARMVLRMMLAQALALGTPPHAVIAASLPLLVRGPRRLAHGVFGTLTRKGAALPDVPTLPGPVAMRWKEAWGEAMVDAAAQAIAAPPPLDLTLARPDETAQWAQRLGGRSLLAGHVRCERAAVETLAGYEEGAWWVQDIAASLPARLLGAGEGRKALDLCAAPGGKTLQLAAQGWDVTAIDQSESRLARLRDNARRTGLANTPIAADIMDWQPDGRFDAILLDAPCSATGIFRRHPDVLYRANERLIDRSAELQAGMLERALGWLAPGGRLVYAVCSLEPQEGEAVVETALDARTGYALSSIDGAALPDGLTPNDAGWLRILPGQIDDPGGCDGFFMAVIAAK